MRRISSTESVALFRHPAGLVSSRSLLAPAARRYPRNRPLHVFLLAIWFSLLLMASMEAGRYPVNRELPFPPMEVASPPLLVPVFGQAGLCHCPAN
jgi:hypothetical protein